MQRSIRQRKRAAHRGLDVRRLNRLELKHRAAAQNRVKHVKIRIFCRGCNERNAAVLDELQQGLLLFFVKILNLVQINQRAVRRHQRAQLVKNLFDVRDGRGRCIEPIQLALGLCRDNRGNRRFSHTGRTVKNHVWNVAALDNPAQQTGLSQNMRLANHIRQCGWADTVGQRLKFHVV